MMTNQRNLGIYRLYAPIYDFVFQPVLAAGRKRAIELLNLQSSERVVIPGYFRMTKTNSRREGIFCCLGIYYRARLTMEMTS